MSGCGVTLFDRKSATEAGLPLRPLSVGEILSAAIAVCRRRFGPMFAIALVLVGIPSLISLIGGCSLDADGSATCTSPIGWLGYFAAWIGTVVASTASVLVAAGAYADVAPGWRWAMRVGLRRDVAIVLATIVIGVPLGIGVLVLVLPGISLDSLSLIVIGFVVLVVLAVFVVVSFAVVWEALIIEGVVRLTVSSGRGAWLRASAGGCSVPSCSYFSSGSSSIGLSGR